MEPAGARAAESAAEEEVGVGRRYIERGGGVAGN